MFRLKGSDSYLITRANALEGYIRVYRVIDGDRDQFANVDRTITANAWHTFGVELTGESIEILCNGERVLSTRDSGFTKGKIGLWTKTDSITRFDDLRSMAKANARSSESFAMFTLDEA